MKYKLILFICVYNFYSLLYAQWLNQQVPPDVGILLSIDFINPNSGVSTGWILNNEAFGRAIYTNNGGNNWFYSSIPDSSRSLVSVQLINSLTGYSAGAYNIFSSAALPVLSNLMHYSKKQPVTIRKLGTADSLIDTRAYFLKTTDAGHSWFPYGTFPQTLYYIVAMSFINESTGFIAAERFYHIIDAHGIYKTTNGGLNWSLSYSVNDTLAVKSINFINSSTGFAAGYDYFQDSLCIQFNGVILKTTNGGTNWTKQLFPEVNNFTNIAFPNSTTGFACGVDNSIDIFKGIVYKTTNSGQNWFKLNYQLDTTIFDGIEFVSASGTGIVYGIEYKPDTAFPGWYYFEHLAIAKTTDFGISWQTSMFDNTEYIYAGSKMLDLNNWYLTGGSISYAKILHTTNGGEIGIEPVSTEIPSSFFLFQNYPNPFNPVTKIRFEIPLLRGVDDAEGDRRGVLLMIYDILGREIATLVNEQLNPGTYEVEWDGTNYSTGVYYYKLTAGSFTQTKKMVLIK